MERPMEIDEVSLDALQRRAQGLTVGHLRAVVVHAVRNRPADGAPAYADDALRVRVEGRTITVTILSIAGRRRVDGDATFTVTVEPGGRVTNLEWRARAPHYARVRARRRR